MYIWRGKSRRDTRQLRLMGEQAWEATEEDHHRNDEDEMVRCELEKKHIEYFHKRFHDLMTTYLETSYGKREVELLRKSLDKYRKTQEHYLLTEEKEQQKQDLLYVNVQQVFHLFSLEENKEEINLEGLHALLEYLGVKMTQKQFAVYCRELNITEHFITVSFEDFYLNFLNRLREQETQKFSSQITSFFSNLFSSVALNSTRVIRSTLFDEDDSPLSRSAKNQRVKFEESSSSKKHKAPLSFEEKADLAEEKGRKSIDVSFFMQLRLQEMEARKLLVDHAVFNAEEIAKREYRIAHPPKHLCEQCHSVFVNKEDYRLHLKDKDFHQQWVRRKVLNDERYYHVDSLLHSGDLGRHLLAYRMIFSPELGTQHLRIAATHYDPFRPQLSDPKGKRRDQLLRGSLVMGFDPMSGVRPAHRRLGLASQHLAAKRIAPPENSLFQVKHPVLQDVVMDLMRCQDDFLDIVSTHEHPLSAQLLAETQLPYIFALARFEWHGISISTVLIKGEFTAWKAEEMLCDNDLSRFFYNKELPPGKYRYRFIVDGRERIDDYCSYCRDETSPIGFSNELLVSAQPLKHVPKIRVIPPSESVIGSSKMKIDKEIKKDRTLATSSKGLTSIHNTFGAVPEPALPILVPAKRRGAITGGVSGQGQGQDSSPRAKTPPVTTSTSPTPPHPNNHHPNQSDDLSVHSNLSDGVEELLGQGNNSPLFSPILAAHAQARDKIRRPGTINHVCEMDREAMIHRLETISLRNLGLRDDGAWAFAINIKRNSFIIHLDLSFNEISDDGIQALSGALLNLQSLKTLKLNGNGFGFDGCRYLCHGLSESETIQVLELCDNRLGDDGVEELCDRLLRFHMTLQFLYLDRCYVGNDGMEAVKNMLIHNRSLVHLSLMSNAFDYKAMMMLLEAIKVNASLLSFNVSHNPAIGAIGAKCVGDMLFYNHSLQSIEINDIDLFSSHNRSGLSSVCYGIKKNTSLIRLCLRGNRIKEQHLVDISDAMLNNNKLLVVDLTGNEVNNDKWFAKDMFFDTPLRKQQPSIATILYRNNLFMIRQGKRLSELMKEFSPPQHHEQLKQIETWKSSKKISTSSSSPSNRSLSASPSNSLLMNNTLFNSTSHTEWNRHRALLGTSSSPSATSPTRFGASAPTDYGQLANVQNPILDDNGNLKLYSDKRKNAVLMIAAPASERVFLSAIGDDVKLGFWHSRRVWRKMPTDDTEKKAAHLAYLSEFDRVSEEKNALKDAMKEYVKAMSLYLDEAPCYLFLTTFARVFAAYCAELSNFDASKDNIESNFRDDKYHHKEALSLQSSRNPHELSLFREGISAKNSVRPFTASALSFDELDTMSVSANSKDPNYLSAANQKLKKQKQRENPALQNNILNNNNKNNKNNSSSQLSLFAFLTGNHKNESHTSSSSTSVSSSSIEQIMRAQFMNVHITFTQAIFTLMESGNKTLLLHPEKLEIALNMLTLPVNDIDDLQQIVDDTLVRSSERIGFHKFSSYLLEHSHRLTSLNVNKRKKLLWDLYFHPPILEAKAALMFYLSANAFKVMRRQYRLNVHHKPRFVCSVCQTRFASDKELQRHLSTDVMNPSSPSHSPSLSSKKKQVSFKRERESEKYRNALPRSTSASSSRKRNTMHKRLLLEQSILESHHLLLRDIKYALTGVYFPAYYELLPAHTLPEDYFPQVMDRIGKVGRPMCVVEPQRTVRALDVIGDYLLVSIHGLTGWIRYRDQVRRRTFLRPIAGFDWARDLAIQESLSYYRVNDNLPKHIELKVRHRPELSAEVIGYLSPGQVIPCFAVIGNWLQVKFGKEDAAWLMFRTEGEIEQTREISRGGADQEVEEEEEEEKDTENNNNNKKTKNSKILKPIRRRKIDYSSKPTIQSLGGFDDSVDVAFDDSIITYEINGKAHRNDTLKNPAISAVKIHFFDFIRYGSLESKTNLNHLLLLPFILQEKLLRRPQYYREEVNDSNPGNVFTESILVTPFALSQRELFEVIVEEMTDLEIINFLEDIDYLPPSMRTTLLTASSSLSSPNQRKKNTLKKKRHRLRKLLYGGSTREFSPVKRTRRLQSARIHTETDNDNNNNNNEDTEEVDSEEEGLSPEQRAARREQNEKIHNYFGKSFKDDIYEESVLEDDVLDDIDFLGMGF